MKRLDYLDKAKGVLIILMVVAHVFSSGYVNRVIYVFHMPAFFVISGILLKYTNACNRKPGAVLKSRLFSFGIPLIAYEATGPLIDIMLNGVTLNLKGYIYNSLTLNLNNKNMWFLISLFCIEVSFVIIYKLIKNDKGMLIFAVALSVLSFLLPKPNHYVEQLLLAMRYYVYFAIGFYFGEKIRNNTAAIIGAIIAVLACAAILGVRGPELTISRIIFVICALCGTYATINLCKYSAGKKIDRILSYIGQNTLIIYGTHHLYYVIFGTMMGIRHFESTPLLTGILILALVTALEIPTIYVINRWLPFLVGKHYKRKVKNV